MYEPFSVKKDYLHNNMNKLFTREILLNVIAVFIKSFGVVLMLLLFGIVGALLYVRGYSKGFSDADSQYTSFIKTQSEINASSYSYTTPTPTQFTKVTQSPFPTKIVWGGPLLWDAVNMRRQQLGVNPLNQKDELCTIASIRLNELLELGKLDGHQGFSTMTERRPDLKQIFDNYSNVTEFLAYGGSSPQETVSLWENTLAHKKLLTGGEYVWGCIYAQNTFAVAITAY